MSLYLKIDSDENFQFFEKYDTLSPLRKKIWMKIAQLTRNWAVAQPSQSKIALWCGCSRSAISEAFRLFREWGWLALLSRGFKKSKTLLLSHSRRQLDVINRQYFKRVEATYRATHTYPMRKNSTGSETGSLDIPIHVQKMSISFENKLKFSLVSEKTRQDALESAKRDSSKGRIFRNEDNYVIGTAIKMAIKRGEKLNWKAFYKMKKAC